jgi:glycosyltransferase involved in cell wall biosynthesis
MSVLFKGESLSGVAQSRASRNTRLQNLRTAIVHYWFVNRRGGERVVEEIAKLFPHADLYFLVMDETKLPDILRSRTIHTSVLQNFAVGRRWYRHFLPVYPLLLEQFDFSGYDLVLSSESGPAKGILTGSNTCHICYCHSPMRYLWDFYHRYRKGHSMGGLSRPIFSLASHYLRLWDAASANRVDYFIANSKTVAARIQKHYRRPATVIHPPVNVASGYLASKIEDYYLCVSQLVDYKRVEIAIQACNSLKRRLRIVGEGEQYGRLRRLAGPTIEFCGALSDDQVHEQYAHCRALLFPGEEDFGMVPVEAMSFGRPVIAFGRGGATETVRGAVLEDSEGVSPTGIFFKEQTEQSMIDALLAFEQGEDQFSPFLIRQHSQQFSETRFRERFSDFVGNRVSEFGESEFGN